MTYGLNRRAVRVRAMCRRHPRPRERPMIRWPRTFRGWKMLFWIALGRCPIHHTRLNVDWKLYDNGRDAYCFDCGVGRWPQTASAALRENHLAFEQKKQREALECPND